MESNRSVLYQLLFGLIFALVPEATIGQSFQDSTNYPNKALRIIVPWVGGGGTDIIARVIAQRLSDNLNQPIVVDNRPGANGILGATIAAKAAPDGYTLVLHAVDHIVNGCTHRKLPYDTIKDFAAVSEIGTQPLVLVVNPSMPAKSVKEFIAVAKLRPKNLSYGSWGDGSLGHLTGELMKSVAGIDMLHVPYQSGPQATTDIIGGRLDLIFTTMPPTVPLIKSGKLRALAVTSAERVPVLNEVPTFIESGYVGFEVDSWRGMYVPASTPKPIIHRLNMEIVRVLKESEVRDRLAGVGIDVRVSTPEELDALSRSELSRWMKVVKRSGIYLD